MYQLLYVFLFFSLNTFCMEESQHSHLTGSAPKLIQDQNDTLNAAIIGLSKNLSMYTKHLTPTQVDTSFKKKISNINRLIAQHSNFKESESYARLSQLNFCYVVPHIWKSEEEVFSISEHIRKYNNTFLIGMLIHYVNGPKPEGGKPLWENWLKQIAEKVDTDPSLQLHLRDIDLSKVIEITYGYNSQDFSTQTPQKQKTLKILSKHNPSCAEFLTSQDKRQAYESHIPGTNNVQLSNRSFNTPQDSTTDINFIAKKIATWGYSKDSKIWQERLASLAEDLSKNTVFKQQIKDRDFTDGLDCAYKDRDPNVPFDIDSEEGKSRQTLECTLSTLATYNASCKEYQEYLPWKGYITSFGNNTIFDKPFTQSPQIHCGHVSYISRLTPEQEKFGNGLKYVSDNIQNIKDQNHLIHRRLKAVDPTKNLINFSSHPEFRTVALPYCMKIAEYNTKFNLPLYATTSISTLLKDKPTAQNSSDLVPLLALLAHITDFSNEKELTYIKQLKCNIHSHAWDANQKDTMHEKFALYNPTFNRNYNTLHGRSLKDRIHVYTQLEPEKSIQDKLLFTTCEQEKRNKEHEVFEKQVLIDYEITQNIVYKETYGYKNAAENVKYALDNKLITQEKLDTYYKTQQKTRITSYSWFSYINPVAWVYSFAKLLWK